MIRTKPPPRMTTVDEAREAGKTVVEHVPRKEVETILRMLGIWEVLKDDRTKRTA